VTCVHPTAVVDPAAKLGPEVEIGPWTVIGSNVTIGAHSVIGAHVVLEGPLTMGIGNHIYPHAVLGTAPQDIKYHNEPTRLEMGDRNLVREFVTIHRGTPQGRGFTRIGSDVFLMAYSHVGHDNLIGNNVVIANSVQLAGHVHLEDYAVIGGCTAIHQFVHIGAHAFVGGGSIVRMDVAPFCKVAGSRARLFGLNSVGLRRRGFSSDQLMTLRRAYRLAFHSNLLAVEAASRIEAELVPLCPQLSEFVAFLRTSERGLTR
jgi:UDP-N-acetylglucosamine acyltransferase